MQIEIIKERYNLELHGFTGTAVGQDYVGTAFKLMDRMWKTVKGNNLKSKGLNIWVYEPNDIVFAGVELDSLPAQEVELEYKQIVLEKYAYYKHIGPYNLIGETGKRMRDELENKRFTVISPYIEIYGHWTNDETRLETELLMAVM